MNITLNKQSSIGLEGSKVLFFDPWDVPYEGKADVIFVTHDHGDHFSPADITKLIKEDTIIVCPKKMSADAAEKTGVAQDKFLAVVPGEKYEANGVSFETIAGYNPGKPFHPQECGWCGYIAELDGKRYYITSDTNIVPEMDGVKCDVLFVPIGGKFTMDAAEAAELTAKLAPECAVPTHYGAVVGTPEDGDTFAKLVAEKAPAVKVELKLFK